MLSLGVRRPSLDRRVTRYLRPTGARTKSAGRRPRPETVLGVVVGAVAGAVLGPVSVGTGVVAGAVAGALLAVLSRRRIERHRAGIAGHELPAIADLLSLYLLAGSSVVGAMRSVCAEASGVVTAEMRTILDQVDRGEGLVEALGGGVQRAHHRDAGRLYQLLAQAHRSGARLVEALQMFASDRRAAIDREVVEEGGRKAITGYGPILGLMIPTTLVFLIYPTVAGLDALAVRP